jgi:hypothetical protein
MEKLGRVVRSQWEDIWVLLDRTDAEPRLELRVHTHGRPEGEEDVAGGEGIGVPVRLLPDLLQALTQAQHRLCDWGLLSRASGASGRLDARRFPRVTMEPAAECRVVDPESPSAVDSIRGTIRDLSQGGAQAWLPRRFPQLKQLDVFMTIDEVSFRGRAEIVGSGELGKAESRSGLYRHHLRWVALHAQGAAALSRIAPSG